MLTKKTDFSRESTRNALSKNWGAFLKELSHQALAQALNAPRLAFGILTQQSYPNWRRQTRGRWGQTMQRSPLC